MHRLHAATAVTAAAFAALGLAACGGSGPTFEPIEDRVVAVGSQLVIELRASSPSGGPIRYDFSSNAPDTSGATLTRRPDGTGLFTWTPTAADVGNWVFDFSAADNGGKATESVAVEVRSAIGNSTLPLFRRPLGAGTAVNMEPGACVEITLLVTDQDSTEVVFREEEPKIEGATLIQESPFEAIWRWCPSEEQAVAQDRYLLTVSADDGENPKAIKRYQIILREKGVRTCGGEPPRLAHVAEDRTTVNPLLISVDVSDDSGLKAAPLVYYSTTRPSDPPDLSTMTQLNMSLARGDSRAGTWIAELPNPVAGGEPGAQQTIYYVLVAEDNDDNGGKCDHLVTQAFAMTVAVPEGEGEGGLGPCEPCTSDSQCGGPDDHCVRAGVEGEAFCFQACGPGGECPEGTICSAAELESVDGQLARQCVPLDESCQTGGSCPDDSFEQNDSRAAAQEIAAGATGGLRMCPLGDLQADEDWYRFTITEDSETRIAIAGDTYPNMELSLLDGEGRLWAASEDWGSEDDVERCLPPGTYDVRVYSYFAGENDYSLELTTAPGDCPDTGGETCTDDAFEDDDDLAQARVPDFEDQAFRSTDNRICSGDDDVFFITLFEGESLWATLDFDQVSPDQDLDLLVYDSSGTLLTPCVEEDPFGCDPYNGQSADADEEMVFTAPAFDEYYVVVHGWAGSENSYDICIALAPDLCTLE